MNSRGHFGSTTSFTGVVGLQSAKFIRAASLEVSKKETIHYLGRFLGLKEVDGWEYAFRTNASGVVVMVPVTDEGELVLVEQYRAPVNSRVIELPAGLVGDNGDSREDFRAAAQRELFEETGYRAGSLEELLTSPSTAGMASEIITIYLARDLRRNGPGGGDASEDITVHHVPIGVAPAWLQARQAEGIMVDHKVYAGLFWAGFWS
jgi:ADP-ribose pyrophosphatase